jgi:predicted phage tail protein
MTQVRLLGELGEKFGTEWTSQHSSVREILKLIDCQVDGFKEYLGECHEKNVQFSIQNGDDFIEEFEELGLQGIVKDTLIITPVPAGSGKGLGKLIAAALLIAAFIFMPGSAGMFANVGAQGTVMTSSGTMMAASQASIAQLVGGTYLAGGAGATAVAGATVGLNFAGMAVAMLGVNLAFMGLAEMSAPDAGGMESDPAFLFNSANSNVEQGQPVPVLYGRLKIGGTPISQGFQSGDLNNADTVYDTDGEEPITNYGDANATNAYDVITQSTTVRRGGGRSR